MKIVWNVTACLTAACVLALAVYGGYWVTKHFSYWWWYEDLVRATIQEMVKPEALR